MPRESTGNKRYNVYMQPKVIEAAKALATRRGTTYSDIIRIATRQYVVEELKKERANG